MKRYSTFPKALELEPYYHGLVIYSGHSLRMGGALIPLSHNLSPPRSMAVKRGLHSPKTGALSPDAV